MSDYYCLKCSKFVGVSDVDRDTFPAVHRVCGGEAAAAGLSFGDVTVWSSRKSEGGNSWGNVDFSRDSLAVVAHAGGGEGVVLWETGSHLEVQVGLCGPCLVDLDLEDAPHGISIWEGKYVHGLPDGKFRRPTLAEMECIVESRSPFVQLRVQEVNDGNERIS